eukprot:909448-Amphidinium_carterae.1
MFGGSNCPAARQTAGMKYAEAPAVSAYAKPRVSLTELESASTSTGRRLAVASSRANCARLSSAQSKAGHCDSNQS